MKTLHFDVEDICAPEGLSNVPKQALNCYIINCNIV